MTTLIFQLCLCDYNLGSGLLEFGEFCLLAAKFLVEEDEEVLPDDITEPFFSTIQPTDGLVPVHPKFTLACSNARDKKYEFLNFKLLLRLAI